MPSDNRTRARVTLSGVRDAYFRGEFEGVLAMSDALRPRDEVDAVEAALLRARALLALNRSEQALGTLRALRLVERPRDEYLTAQMLTGAVEILRDARASASSAHPTVRAEIALHLGIAHFRRGEHADADRISVRCARCGEPVVLPADMRLAEVVDLLEADRRFRHRRCVGEVGRTAGSA